MDVTQTLLKLCLVAVIREWKRNSKGAVVVGDRNISTNISTMYFADNQIVLAENGYDYQKLQKEYERAGM